MQPPTYAQPRPSLPTFLSTRSYAQPHSPSSPSAHFPVNENAKAGPVPPSLRRMMSGVPMRLERRDSNGSTSSSTSSSSMESASPRAPPSPYFVSSPFLTASSRTRSRSNTTKDANRWTIDEAEEEEDEGDFGYAVPDKSTGRLFSTSLPLKATSPTSTTSIPTRPQLKRRDTPITLQEAFARSISPIDHSPIVHRPSEGFEMGLERVESVGLEEVDDVEIAAGGFFGMMGPRSKEGSSTAVGLGIGLPHVAPLESPALMSTSSSPLSTPTDSEISEPSFLTYPHSLYDADELEVDGEDVERDVRSMAEKKENRAFKVVSRDRGRRFVSVLREGKIWIQL